MGPHPTTTTGNRIRRECTIARGTILHGDTVTVHMTDTGDSDEVYYQCGACGRAQSEEDVKIVEHPNESLGEFPICIEGPCSIRDVGDPTSSSSFRVDDTLH